MQHQQTVSPEPEAAGTASANGPHADETSADETSADETGTDGLFDRALAATRKTVRRHPLAAVGGAFATGFVLGNGLPKFIARAGVTIALRMVIKRIFDDVASELDTRTTI